MDISRMANLPAVNQTNLTRTGTQRTEMKSSTLASEHTDSFIKSQQSFTPAYTKNSAQKQNAGNNLLQREDSDTTVDKINADAKRQENALTTTGIKHIVRAMLVKQGEVLSGSVPSIGAKQYADELLAQMRRLYGGTAADENNPDYWQPEATADRMISFFDCVSLKETDRDRMAILEHAFSGAFRDTEQLFGGRGRLPLESYETKQLIQERYFARSVR